MAISDATFDDVVFGAGTGYTLIAGNLGPECYYEVSGTWTGTDFALWRNWSGGILHIGKVILLGNVPFCLSSQWSEPSLFTATQVGDTQVNTGLTYDDC